MFVCLPLGFMMQWELFVAVYVSRMAPGLAGMWSNQLPWIRVKNLNISISMVLFPIKLWTWEWSLSCSHLADMLGSGYRTQTQWQHFHAFIESLYRHSTLSNYYYNYYLWGPCSWFYQISILSFYILLTQIKGIIWSIISIVLSVGSLLFWTDVSFWNCCQTIPHPINTEPACWSNHFSTPDIL